MIASMGEPKGPDIGAHDFDKAAEYKDQPR